MLLSSLRWKNNLQVELMQRVTKMLYLKNMQSSTFWVANTMTLSKMKMGKNPLSLMTMILKRSKRLSNSWTGLRVVNSISGTADCVNAYLMKRLLVLKLPMDQVACQVVPFKNQSKLSQQQILMRKPNNYKTLLLSKLIRQVKIFRIHFSKVTTIKGHARLVMVWIRLKGPMK